MAARKSKPNHPSNDPDAFITAPPPEATNHDHPATPGAIDNEPGAGLVDRDADVSRHKGGPGRDVPGAQPTSPGAQRVGTTEGRAASAARGGATGGIEEIEAPSTQGQTALNPATSGTGAPQPASSGIRATSDPNFNAQRADEEGVPSKEALAEQAASIRKEHKKQSR